MLKNNPYYTEERCIDYNDYLDELDDVVTYRDLIEVVGPMIPADQIWRNRKEIPLEIFSGCACGLDVDPIDDLYVIDEMGALILYNTPELVYYQPATGLYLWAMRYSAIDRDQYVKSYEYCEYLYDMDVEGEEAEDGRSRVSRRMWKTYEKVADQVEKNLAEGKPVTKRMLAIYEKVMANKAKAVTE